MTDRTAGFPTILGANRPPRPADSMVIQWGDTTMVGGLLSFGGLRARLLVQRASVREPA